MVVHQLTLAVADAAAFRDAYAQLLVENFVEAIDGCHEKRPAADRGGLGGSGDACHANSLA
jgi:hypothetical protein